ncbi:MAG: TPM domain-containing protein [Brevirhabdus sp.]
MKQLITTLFLVCLPLFASAQQQEGLTLPDFKSTTLNDFASLLEPEAADRVAASLKELKADHDIEMTVVTLETRHDFGDWASMERFATALFNKWGIGDADRNDGIMLLVLRTDREMRIELGRGYDRDWYWVAQNVIDDFILPRFRDDEYSVGIEAGVNATIREIALPFTEGRAPAGPSFVERASNTILFVIFGAIFVLFAFGRKITDAFQRLRNCPQCGSRGTLRRTRNVLRAASRTMSGQGERFTRCTNCDYEDHRIYTIAKRRSSSSSSGSFGGGSSSGGGASGRW